MNRIEVCLSPSLFKPDKTDNKTIIIIVDVLRATTAFCAAFDSCVKTIMPVESLDELKLLKKEGFLTAAERGGERVDFAEFGNSPVKFLQSNLRGKDLAYSTTNGTKAIEKVKSYSTVVTGAFVNLEVLCEWIRKQHQDLLVICSGWNNEVSFEDTLCAGAIVESLEKYGHFQYSGDAAKASLQLWQASKNNLITVVQDAEHYQRLVKLGAIEDLEYCFKLNCSQVVPYWDGSVFINLNSRKLNL